MLSRLTDRQRNICCLLVLILFTLLLYGRVVSFSFVRWDDPILVTENPLVSRFSPEIFWSYDPELYVPATLLTYQVEFAMVGPEPWLFHATNVILHIANALLVFWLLLILTKQRGLALLGSILFALHPLHAEAVSWVSGRKELLFTFFVLGSMLAYLRERRWIAVGLFLFALLSKVTAVTLPVLLLLIDWQQGKLTIRSVRDKWLFFVLAAIFAFIALFGRGENVVALDPLSLIALSLRSITFTLQHLVAPFGLSAIYGAPSPLTFGNPTILLSVFALVALIALGYAARRRFPLAVIGLIFFFVALAPSLLAYQKANDITLTSDRYAYLPSVGFILMLLGFLLPLWSVVRWQKVVAALSVPFLALSGWLAFVQSGTWRDSARLFAHVLSVDPRSHVAWNNLGFYKMMQGDMEGATHDIQNALSLKKNYPDALVNAGVIEGRKGDYTAAEMLLRRALDIQPKNAQAHFNMAGVHFMRGELDAAIGGYQEALRINPHHAQALWQLSQALLHSGSISEARETYRRLLELDESYRGRNEQLDALLNRL